MICSKPRPTRSPSTPNTTLDRTKRTTCGHCHTVGIPAAYCHYCRTFVCAQCLHCPVAHPHVMHLGWGVRLWAVDPTGRLGQVTRGLGDSGIFDLQRERTIGTLPDTWPADSGQDTQVLVHVGHFVFGPTHVVCLVLRYNPGRAGRPVKNEYGLLVVDTRHGYYSAPDLHPLPEADGRKLALSENGRFAAYTAGHRIGVLDIERRRPHGLIDSMEHVIHTICVHAGLVVLGAESEVQIFRLDDLRPLGVKGLSPGAITAIAMAAGKMATVSQHGIVDVVEIMPRRLPHHWPRIQQQDLDTTHVTQSEFSLSPDGLLLATRRGRRRVMVINLEDDAPQVLTSHTDRLTLICFAEQGQMLITADKDNRVIFWPRAGNRLVTGKIER